MKDEEFKVEEIEDSHTLSKSQEGRKVEILVESVLVVYY